MKNRSASPTVASLLGFALLLLPTAAQACTACMGDPNSKTAGAINAAIFLMLGFIALMLGSLAAFAWYLFRRQTTAGIDLSDTQSASGAADALS